MNSYLAPSGIRFNDYMFSEPKPLGGWVQPRCAGVFVLLMRDPNWAPLPLQTVLFGEFGNDSREILQPHDQALLAAVVRPETLLVSVLPMPFSTTAQRSAICKQLIWAYNPACQTNGNSASSSELVRKLEELEKKHEEQSTYMQLLLANVNKMFEPNQPERPKRQVGFLAPPVSAA
jgi:hypothetical protein